MTPDQIDRVFGCGRLKMVTGEHVEVFREAACAGERRRYTKRFLNTLEADFAHWTEREWRILARLIGHGIDCVPEVVQFDRGAPGGTKLVQTYDAGATVDQWATILPVSRDGRVLRHVFEDCAHWWALAHHSLRALFAIHELSVVHLDIKGDNVCIPVGPASFDPDQAGLPLYPRFAELALIDFAFALVSRESLTTALPIGWQTDYDYQSPRLLNALEAGRRGDLQPTRELDWRCDMYSLAAMLKRYLPDDDAVIDWGHASGWTLSRAAAAKELILALRDAHDRDAPHRRPHQDLMLVTAAQLAETDMASSLSAGWALARDAQVTPVAGSPLTPLTRLAPSIRVFVSPRARGPVIAAPPTVIRRRAPPPATPRKPRAVRAALVTVLVAAALAALATPIVLDRWPIVSDTIRSAFDSSPRATESARANEAPPPPESPPPESPPAPQPAPAAAESAPPAVAAPAEATKPSTPAASRGIPARPARIAADPPRKTTPPASKPVAPQVAIAKPPPPRLASTPAAPAQPRVRFHVPPEPVSVASAPPSPPVQVASTAPLVELMPRVATPEPTRAEPAPPAAARPPSAEPGIAKAPAPSPPPARAASPAIVQDVRNVLGYLFGFAKRTDRSAPIEDRTPSPAKPAPPQELPRIAAAPSESPSFAIPTPPETQARELAPRAMPPAEALTQPTVRAFDPAQTDLAAQGRRTLSESVPNSAARAEQEIARVLWIAAGANQPGQDRNVVDAVRRTWSNNTAASMPASVAPAVARQLSDDARQAFMVQRDTGRAFELQLRAFGANPRDAEVAGNLAFLFLRLSPAQPEIARQLAMHAIAVNPAQLRTTRADDWQTLAIANALTGRESDATNALYVTIALSRNLDRTCKAALAAVDSYGDRMVAPVQAMMLRIRQQSRDHESLSCAWPPRWQSARGG